MSGNVLTELERVRPAVAERLAQNYQVASAMTGMVARIHTMAYQCGKPIGGIRIKNVQMTSGWRNNSHSGTVSAKIEFTSLELPHDHLWQGSGGKFADFLLREAKGLSDSMRRNPDIGKFFDSICDYLDKYCRDRFLPFERLLVQQCFITKDGELVFQFGKDIYDPYKRKPRV